MANFADLWKPKKTMRDWGRTEYKVVPNWTPRDVRVSRSMAPVPPKEGASSSPQIPVEGGRSSSATHSLSASLRKKNLKKQAPSSSPLLPVPAPLPGVGNDRASDSNQGASSTGEDENEDMVANGQGYPHFASGNMGDTVATSLDGDESDANTSSAAVPSSFHIPALLSLQQLTSELPSIKDTTTTTTTGQDGGASTSGSSDTSPRASRNRPTSDAARVADSAHSEVDSDGDSNKRILEAGGGYISSDGEAGGMDFDSQGDTVETASRESRGEERKISDLSEAESGGERTPLGRLDKKHNTSSDIESVSRAGHRVKIGKNVNALALNKSVLQSSHSELHATSQTVSVSQTTHPSVSRPQGSRGGRKRQAVAGASVNVKLWKPKHVTRSKKHLNELDVCLTACEEAVIHSLDEVESVPVERVLLNHWKHVQKHLLSVVRQSHTVTALDARLKKERSRHRKLQNNMLKVLSTLRKSNAKYQKALGRAQPVKESEELAAAESDVDRLSLYLRPFFAKYHASSSSSP